ncbi:MAG: hypothetical protein JWO33_593 [Caulobacteraceae bacterium]|nr:hypothetical protein [Caulobacteraceae bacterium]
MWSDPEAFAYERGLARWEGEGGRIEPPRSIGPEAQVKPANPAVSFRVYRPEDRTVTQDEQARLASRSLLDRPPGWAGRAVPGP